MITALSLYSGGLGRFGNQLFTIAGVIGIAVKNGHSFGFPKWINQDNALFGGTIDDMGEYFVNPLPPIPDVNWRLINYQWAYEDLILPNGNYNIYRHLQSQKYFDHCIELVRHYFTLKDEPEYNDYCAIHYRAGDYINNPEAFHPRCSKEYYAEAICRFEEGTKFMVFSDSHECFMNEIYNELPDHIIFHYHFEFSKEKNYLDDFRLMKRCRHFIIANSSFSCMASILSDQPGKIIISPKRWFGKEGEAWSTEDVHPLNAIII